MMKLDIQRFGGRGSKSSPKKQEPKKQKSNFNDFRFEGLNVKKESNNYITMERVNPEKDRIVVKVGDNHLKKTPYGYALVLDEKNVVFVKDWQVSQNYYGNEVVLTKQYFKPREWGNHSEFSGINKENHNWSTWLKTAQSQKNTKVKWEYGEKARKKAYNRLMYGG